MVSHWKVVISSSLEELASSSSPSSSPSLSAEASREGYGEAAKPPRWPYRQAIWLTRVFSWYNSSVRVSRRASMHWSCAIMASTVTSPVKEKGAEVEGIAEAAGPEDSIHDRINGTHGSVVRRIRNRDGKVAKDLRIAVAKMSLSWVAVS